MPQPMKPIAGQDFYSHARALESCPECAARIGVIASVWAHIEEGLARWFGWLAGEPYEERKHEFEVLNRKRNEPFAAALTAIENLHLRIVVIRAAMHDRATEAQREEFELLAQELRARAGERNTAVHSAWVVTPRYPKDVIVYREKGWVRYTPKDFDAIIDRLEATDTKLVRLAGNWANEWAARKPPSTDPPPNT